MRCLGIAAGVVAGVVCASTGLSAQLGEIARKEAERRKAIKSSGRTYTNDSLTAPSAPAATTPPPAAPPAATPASGVSDEEARKKDEEQWRARMARERDALARAQSFHDALQSRINALYTDFVNRDDPAQRSVIAEERQKSLAELEKLKTEIERHTKAIAAIQDEARRAGVPPGWVR